MAVFGRSLVALTCAALGALGAQTPAKPACDIGDALRGSAGIGTLNVDLARQAGPGPVAVSKLKAAVKALETPGKGDDPVGRAYVLGSAYSLWLNQPGVGATPRRGDIGHATNPDQTIDLIGAVDSLFRVVEAAKPLCRDNTSYYRGGQKFYLDLVNGAINALNADKLDSAQALAQQAQRLYSGSPYGSMILGSVASKRNDTTRAVQYWTEAVQAAGSDTLYRDVHRQMLNNLGSVYLARATAGQGAERAAAARKAAEFYSALVAIPGTHGPYLTSGRASLQGALLLAGDTAAAVHSYEALLANPTAFETTDLLNSAVTAARANRPADAGKLFDAVLAQNPYSRDALFNIAVTRLSLNENDKVAPIVTRLVAIDPANQENYNLAARAYLALAKAAEKAKQSALVRAYNDSTLQWYTRGNKLPVEVAVTEFMPTESGLSIAGTITDRRDKLDSDPDAARPAKGKGKAAAKAPRAAQTPQPVMLTFEALDRTGTVVGKQSVTTDALAPGANTRFSIKIAAANAVAYRYHIDK